MFFRFPFMEHTFLDCKQYVGSGINTLMSISDGLGPSILCSMMEKARPMREEMHGKIDYFPPESAFLTLML